MITSISPDLQPVFALTVVFLMFAMFYRATFSNEVVALVCVSIFLVSGVLPFEDALETLSNPAPWTIVAMFVIMGALSRTGVLNELTEFIQKLAKRSKKSALAVSIGFVVIASGFVSNTPVVMVMIPVFVEIARLLGLKTSKLLIPLSYSAILGGTLTLIGTSTNLIVDGVIRAEGLKGFGIFEVTPLGLVLVIWGILYLRYIAPVVLPDRESMSSILPNSNKKKYFSEAVIPPGSNLIGNHAIKVEMFKRDGIRLMDIVRDDKSLRHSLKNVILAVGDRVVLRTRIIDLLNLQGNKNIQRFNHYPDVETTTVEVLITPGCKLIGQSLGNMALRRRFKVYVLAVHRHNQNRGFDLENHIVQMGDTLLVEGAETNIQRLVSEMKLIEVAKPTLQAFRKSKAPIAIFSVLSMVVFAALGLAPIYILAFLSMSVVLASKAIDSEEAFSLIDGRLIALIISMLMIGAALKNSGAIYLVVDNMVPYLDTLSPFFVIWSVYLLTAVLTELISNNAVAIVVTPIAISLADALGYDARPFIVAVMVAASASFATPIGYQTNLLVYAPGGYKFSDFTKVGLPLSISVSVISALLIPHIWPL